jgi:hypothetical protein
LLLRCRGSREPVSRGKKKKERKTHIYIHLRELGNAGRSDEVEKVEDGGPIYLSERTPNTMPSRLTTPVLTVDPAKIHEVDTRNAENLHGMWMGECYFPGHWTWAGGISDLGLFLL